MSGVGTFTVCGRDLAALRAVAAGRCHLRAGCEAVLLVDGMSCADSSTVHRLVAAGLISPPAAGQPFGLAALTDEGRRALVATDRGDAGNT